jgi:hypothetical protein
MAEFPNDGPGSQTHATGPAVVFKIDRASAVTSGVSTDAPVRQIDHAGEGTIPMPEWVPKHAPSGRKLTDRERRRIVSHQAVTSGAVFKSGGDHYIRAGKGIKTLDDGTQYEFDGTSLRRRHGKLPRSKKERRRQREAMARWLNTPAGRAAADELRRELQADDAAAGAQLAARKARREAEASQAVKTLDDTETSAAESVDAD